MSCIRLVPFGALLLAFACAMTVVAESATQPNIVLFLSDDHGYADSGAYGDTYVKTPNIDRLASAGMRFTHAFAENPLCSPSRACIFTGVYPFRNGAHKFGTALRPRTKTLPAYFRKLSYYTAHFGKWHQKPDSLFPYHKIDKEKRPQQCADNVVRFVKNYAAKKPLLLVVCAWPPHQPWTENTEYDTDRIKLPSNFIDTPKTRECRAKYYSDVTLMDRMLGDVLTTLDNRGMRDNTLLVYSSDQGAMWPFGKWCLYDDGLRVPLVVRWPGVVEPGSTSDAMVQLIDLIPTFMEAAGATPPSRIDGRSIIGVLGGEKKEHREIAFATHTEVSGAPENFPNNSPARTIRTRDLRYILNLRPDAPFQCGVMNQRGTDNHYWPTWEEKAKTDPGARRIVDAYTRRPLEELYDLRTDPYQMKNVVDDPAYADQLKTLRTALAAWRKQQGDNVPVPQNGSLEPDKKSDRR